VLVVLNYGVNAMAYRKSNDNWKQLLLKLDELGVKPLFIHLLVTRWTWQHIEDVRTDLVMACVPIHRLCFYSLAGCVETIEENAALRTLCRQLKP
jgi:hypothetical protein